MDPLLGALNASIDSVVGKVLPSGRQVALLDFPSHTNVGDSAIWLGEVSWLRRQGDPIQVTCELASYSAKRIRRAIGGDAVIAIHGGGNFGDFWPVLQAFREQVLKDFPDRLIIQLPQTLGFRSPEGMEGVRRRLAGHDRFIVLCRDSVSLDLARSKFGLQAELCPDMAFAIGDLSAGAPAPVQDVVWLARTDSEASARLEPPPASGVTPVDWLDPRTDRLGRRLEFLAARATAHQRGLDAVPAALDRIANASVEFAYRRRAEARVAYGRSLLSTGSVVVSDRLHVHILCLLLKKPHVIVDTGYGKLSSFVREWTHTSPLLRLAESPAEALACAKDLLSQNG